MRRTERTPPATRAESAPPSAWRLFYEFSRIGLTSFGGGVSGWLLRVFVRDHAWISEEEFLNGLSLAQALPGVNVKNMAIWIGYRLRGTAGAAIGFAGIIGPPAVFIVLLGVVFASLTRFPITHIALDGAAAAAIGLSLTMGITAARRVPRRILPMLVMAAVFVSIGVFHWPLVPVVLAGATISIPAAWRALPER